MNSEKSVTKTEFRLIYRGGYWKGQRPKVKGQKSNGVEVGAKNKELRRFWEWKIRTYERFGGGILEHFWIFLTFFVKKGSGFDKKWTTFDNFWYGFDRFWFLTFDDFCRFLHIFDKKRKGKISAKFGPTRFLTGIRLIFEGGNVKIGKIDIKLILKVEFWILNLPRGDGGELWYFRRRVLGGRRV